MKQSDPITPEDLERAKNGLKKKTIQLALSLRLVGPPSPGNRSAHERTSCAITERPEWNSGSLGLPIQTRFHSAKVSVETDSNCF